MPRASGAVNASRPAALAWSRIFRTALLSYDMLQFSLECYAGVLTFSRQRAANQMTFFDRSADDIRGPIPQFREHFVGVFTEQRRALDLGGAVAHFDGIADGQVFAALGMVDLDDGTGLAQ